MSSKKTAKPKAGKKESPLNLRNLPTKVSGFPDAFYTQYTVEIHISGRNSTVLKVRELDESGLPGRYIQADEAKKLASAPGLVRDLLKKLGQTDANENAKRFFYNTKIEPDKIKDPILFQKQLGTYAKNLAANKKVVDQASDHVPENTVMKAMMYSFLDTAKTALSTFLEKNKAGQKFTIKEAAKESGLPSSMLGKTLTDTIKMSPGAPFWSTLIGKDPSKFCNVTLQELVDSGALTNNQLFSPAIAANIRELATEKEIQIAFGITDGNAEKLTQNQRDKYMSQTLPINLGLSKTALLQRAESAKTAPKKRSLGIFPKLDILVNLILDEYYISPPTSISNLQSYWESVVGQSLDKPEIASKTFSAQALAIMEVSQPQTAFNPGPAGWPTWAEFKIDGLPIESLEKDLAPKGFRDQKYMEYNPVCFQNKAKAKATRLQQQNSMLTKPSNVIVAELVKQFGREIGKEVSMYLGTFTEKKLQTMAAEIVWITCRLDRDVAERKYFHMEKEDQEPLEEKEADGSEDEGPDEDGGDYQLPLPDPGDNASEGND
jgi:hypothetical protein